jgi:Fe-S cluster assembly protein SufA/iron-sulfur cluster assembly protein
MVTQQNTIILTDAAVHMLHQLAHQTQKTQWGLKFADEVSVCGEGYNYVIDLVFSPEDQDEIFLSNGIEIYVPKKSLSRLVGSIIDAEMTGDGTMSSHCLKKFLHVKNPNITGPCPCACGDWPNEWTC